MKAGDADVYISTLASRNRALPNDIVAVMLEPKRNWRVCSNNHNIFRTSMNEYVKIQ